MKKRIILVGKAAAGKDYLRKILIERGFNPAVSFTPRPPRPGELSGQDYNFISIELANEYIKRGKFLEYVVFNEWIYGTTLEQWNSEDIFIMTPKGLAHLGDKDRQESLVLYLNVPKEVRMNRLLSRKMPGDSIERRMIADDLDFETFSNYDVEIKDETFDWSYVESILKNEKFLA